MIFFRIILFPWVPGKAPDRYALLAKRDVRMAGYWPSSFFAFLLSAWLSKGNKNAKKERGQCPVIMTKQAWSIKNLLYGQKENFFSWDWNNQTWATSFCSGSQSERRIRFILPSRRSDHCNKLTFHYSSNLWHWKANTIRAFHLKVLSGLTWFPFSARNAI